MQAPEGVADLQRALKPRLQRHRDLLLAPQGEYKNLLLERLIKGVKVDSSSLIMQSIQKVDQEKAKKCVAAGLKSIRTQA